MRVVYQTKYSKHLFWLRTLLLSFTKCNLLFGTALVTSGRYLNKWDFSLGRATISIHLVCLECIHTLTDIYRSCTDVARQIQAFLCAVGSLLHRSELVLQGTSRSLITQCHSLPLLAGRARQDSAPAVRNSCRIVPSYMTQITAAVLLRSSFLLILPSFSHRQVCPSQAHLCSPMGLSTFTQLEKKSPAVLYCRK